MLVMMGEGKVRNNSVAVQDARGAHRHYTGRSRSQRENAGHEEKLTPSQYSIVTAGPMALSNGLKVEGSSASSSCLADTVAVCAGAVAEVSGRQSVHVGSRAVVDDIVGIVVDIWERLDGTKTPEWVA